MPGFDEFELIDRYFRPLATDAGALNLTDDAAIMTHEPGLETVVATDTVVGGVHFFPDDPPSAIARKALRVNISDLVAKGAEPFAYTLSLSLPDGIDARWVAAFAGGLRRDQAEYGISLLGGDTTRSPAAVSIAITAFGRLPEGSMVRRSGGRADDAVYVSGAIGEATAGLLIRRGEIARAAAGRGGARLERRYLVPTPRATLAGAIRRHAAAALDVSDGLWADLGHMCAASGVSASVAAESVPMSPPTRRLLAAGQLSIERVLTGGDDYEVLAAVPPARAARFEAEAAAADVPVTRIGVLVSGEGPPVVTSAGVPLVHPHSLGHAHF